MGLGEWEGGENIDLQSPAGVVIVLERTSQYSLTFGDITAIVGKMTDLEKALLSKLI